MSPVPLAPLQERISSGRKSALTPEILKSRRKRGEVKPSANAPRFFRKAIGMSGAAHRAILKAADCDIESTLSRCLGTLSSAAYGVFGSSFVAIDGVVDDSRRVSVPKQPW